MKGRRRRKEKMIRKRDKNRWSAGEMLRRDHQGGIGKAKWRKDERGGGGGGSGGR